MKIEITRIDEFPLQHIGRVAGTCWGANVDDSASNIQRAKSCIRSGHGRVMEYADIEIVISEMSARCMREIYTHIVGTSRLQASTRYISEESGFGYFTPDKAEGNTDYHETMAAIQEGYNRLLSAGVPKEDAANVLPLGMESKMVLKINLRSLVNFMNMRLCSRAYHEIRKFAIELRRMLSEVNCEWKWIADSILVPKCEMYKYINPSACFCVEAQCCGRHPKLSDLKIVRKDNDDK